ncbi:MAG: cytochrome c3 family protein [Acidobacteria bacterium]|nr:cytochrome c3 family protein [Acidobacteriota bacterium]MBI3473692.1 cytochrome c3 family protein [Candidatus Solibacter usitatus]
MCWADRFSHKKHAPLKMECVTCHATSETGERAGFPPNEKCAVCHQGVEQPEPRRLYRVADFVFFSHARHRAAKLPCAACHGDVAARDAPRLHYPTTMKACIGCHKAHRAGVSCNLCHELNQ